MDRTSIATALVIGLLVGAVATYVGVAGLSRTTTATSVTTTTQTATTVIERNTTLTIATSVSANTTVADGVFVVPPESQLSTGYRANSRAVGNNQTGLLIKDFEVTKTTYLFMDFGPGTPVGPVLSPLNYQVAVISQNTTLYESSVLDGGGNATLILPPGDTAIVAVNPSADFTMLVFLYAFLY